MEKYDDFYHRCFKYTTPTGMVLIPEGTKVQNYGYYTSYNGTKWLYIQVTLNGVQYTGFSCKTYLKKQ